MPYQPSQLSQQTWEWRSHLGVKKKRKKKSHLLQALNVLQNCEKTHDFCHFKSLSFGLACALIDNQTTHQFTRKKHHLHLLNEEMECSEVVSSLLKLTEQVNVGSRLKSQHPHSNPVVSRCLHLLVSILCQWIPKTLIAQQTFILRFSFSTVISLGLHTVTA